MSDLYADEPPEEFADVPLSWGRSDPERMLGFSGGRFTRVGGFPALIVGVLLGIVCYGALLPFRETAVGAMFFEQGLVPYAITLLTAWSLAILGFKWLKLRLQRKALRCRIVPETAEFVLSPDTVDVVQNNILRQVEDPRRFVLFRRINVALSNLRNLGRVGDVDEILRGQADADDAAMETSYSVLQAFVWAVPVLGFIGTVQGLSGAIGKFGRVLEDSEEVSQIKESLKGVTGDLSLAFETTLMGLVAALFIQMLLTGLKKAEEEFLDACGDYCTRHVVGRLRMTAPPDFSAPRRPPPEPPEPATASVGSASVGSASVGSNGSAGRAG